MSPYRSELAGRRGTDKRGLAASQVWARWRFIITEKWRLSHVIYVLFMLCIGHTQLRACIYVCYVLPGPAHREGVCVCGCRCYCYSTGAHNVTVPTAVIPGGHMSVSVMADKPPKVTQQSSTIATSVQQMTFWSSDGLNYTRSPENRYQHVFRNICYKTGAIPMKFGT